MADEVEIEDEPIFDAAEAAAELEAQRAAGEVEPTDDQDQDDDDIDDGAEAEDETVEVAPKAKPVAKASEDDVEPLEGKPVSYAVFKKRLDREIKKRQEAEAYRAKHDQLAAEYDGYKKTQPFGPEQAGLYKQYEDIFGKLKSGTKSMPFLDKAIADLARGKTPDLRALHQALGEHVQSLPEGDPRLFQRQQELDEKIARIEEAEFDRSFNAHIEREEAAVSKLLGENPDPELVQLIDEVHLSMIPEKGDLSKMPDKVKIAKLLLSRDSKLEQRILKKQIPAAPLKRRAAVPSGGGPAAPVKQEVETLPEPGTPEWDEYIAAGYKPRG